VHGRNEGKQFEVVLDNGHVVRQKIEPNSAWPMQLSRFSTDWIIDRDTLTCYTESGKRIGFTPKSAKRWARWAGSAKANSEKYRGTDNSQRNRGQLVRLCSSGFCLFLCT
jgi:hypothetical protein